MTQPWDRKRAAHLHRRAGFSGTPQELDEAVSLGREGAVSRLVDYDTISTAELEANLGLWGFDLDGYQDVPFDRFNQLLRWWFLRMQYTPRPLEEKMTLFWHNHFATSISKVGDSQLMYAQNQIFRELAMGKFGDLLLAVSKDPAMLIWLDNATNVKDAPNENFAREVMELFTMGVGHYTQQDVKEAARAFTGWTVDAANHNRFLFTPRIHDYGVKGFLGKYGTWFGEDIVTMLAERPETAAFMTVKLARFFVGADPTPSLAASLQATYLSTDGDIREIVRLILLSEEFDAAADNAEVIKTPVEFVVGMNRSLGLLPDYSGDYGWIEQMGMALFRPPNVAGWPGGRTWIHTAAYLWRINFAMNHATFPSPWGDVYRFDISRFFENRNFASADELIVFIADRLSLSRLSDTLRDAVRNFLALSGDPFVWTPASYGFGRGALFLMMSSPEYQLQ